MGIKTIEKVVASSIVCGYAVTQPFFLYADAQSLLQDQLLEEEILYGENSEIVRHLQQKLSTLGHYDDTIDGIFGLLTEHAIKGFQSSHSINVTGKADKKTMEALVYMDKKVHITAIKHKIDSIHYGAESEDVKKVQELLFYYGYYKGSIDGIYGPLTDDAIDQVVHENLLIDERINSPSEVNEESKRQDDTIVQVKVEGSSNNIILEAKSHIGTPYVWGGTSPSGFDCSGFIQYIYEQQNITIPRTVSEIWNFSRMSNSPSIGDLVFFETYQPGPSHLGIYLGNGDFIHAGSSRGVEISNLNNSYWKPRYLGAKKV